MAQVKWGIIGPGAIAGNFAQGLAECDSGVLAAIASRNAGRLADFGDRFGVDVAMRFDSYDAIMASDIDAIYIATPHPFHAQLAIKAMRSGKHVLVEKPAGLIAGEVVALTEVAAQTGVFFTEGLMYRCHPQIAHTLELIRSGKIGDVQHVEASFGFAAGYDPTSRLFDPALAGGAILDVGLYPVSCVRLIAGAALGTHVAAPEHIAGTGTLAASGVDDVAYAVMRFAGGITATVSTAIARVLDNSVTVTGTKGRIHLPDPWVPGRDAGPSDASIIVTTDTAETVTFADPRILFAHEAEFVSRAILDGATQAPAPGASWDDSIGTARVLDSWREQLGYALPGETPGGLRRLSGMLPDGLPTIPRTRIAGADADISTLILGCDNRDTLAEGALVWDAWWDAGGNAFDTAHVYGGGRHEALLGQWMTARGVSKDAQVIVKGAHTPYDVPQAIAVELAISLERLQLDRAPVYILHRDNLQVPVGEFMVALNDLADKGLIGAFGGSNWTPARLQEANDYAAANGLRPMQILNNNLSLAVMERPVWTGCITANTPDTLGYLRESGTAHIAWSSQARGFFLDPGEGTTLPAGTEGDLCYASVANTERRKRAVQLANEKGVAAHQIATAWVLGQSFPSLAVIGPRSPGEIASTLAALNLALTPDEIAWLNLEVDDAGVSSINRD